MLKDKVMIMISNEVASTRHERQGIEHFSYRRSKGKKDKREEEIFK